MKTLKLVVTLITGLSLTACSTIGMHMPAGDDSNVTTSSSLDGQVKIRPITPALIRSLQQPAPTAKTNEQLEQERKGYDYIVGIGDVLNITVWNHPELTIPAGSERSPQEAGNWVHSDGTIFYPYIGEVHVAGKKVTEIRDMVTQKLAEYIESPQVDVTVAGFRSKRVYITGEVKQPGSQPITNIPLTLIDAVTTSGGLTEMADWTRVVLTRNGQEKVYNLRELYQRGNIGENVMLREGDIVHVSRNDSNKVFVLGEVAQPGAIPVQRYGMTLTEALSEAKGLDKMNADVTGVFVMRPSELGSNHLVDVYQLNASSPTALVLAEQFTLQERDIVYVTAEPVAQWNRLVQQILPTAQVLYYGSLTEERLNDRL